MKTKVDINSDLGESFGMFKIGDDAGIMPFITSANIACGFHAGDPMTMAQTVSLAKKHGVAVGAHPGFPDLMGFGRREMQLRQDEAKNYLIYQIGALQGFARSVGANLQHVKPHGALYNMAAKDTKLAEAVTEAVEEFDSELIVFALPNSALAKIANKAGLRVAHEFFADRAYNPDGSLVSRTRPESVIEEPDVVIERATEAVLEGKVKAFNGRIVDLGEVHTICVHGDTSTAVRLAEAIRKGFKTRNIEVKPVGNFL
jgi:UPF0271 protein